MCFKDCFDLRTTGRFIPSPPGTFHGCGEQEHDRHGAHHDGGHHDHDGHDH